MQELIRELIDVPGVQGFEDDIRAAIESKLPEKASRVTDNMGNLVATLGTGEKQMMFSAHMDELGFIVTEVLDSGFLRVRSLGTSDKRTVFGRSVWLMTEKGKIPGVFCVKPPHLMPPQSLAKEMAETPEINDFIIDIGASSKREAGKMGVSILTPAVIQKQFNILNKKFISCRALDDRAGCAILIEAMKRLENVKLGWKVHFAFSVQEEGTIQGGMRGAALLANTYKLDMAFAVDTASAADFPAVRRDLSTAVLGKGPGLRVLDNRAMMTWAFTKELIALAKKVRIPVQLVTTGGATDAMYLQTGGAKTMPIAFPVRYTHAAVEMVHAGDLENCVRFVCEIVKRYALAGKK